MFHKLIPLFFTPLLSLTLPAQSVEVPRPADSIVSVAQAESAALVYVVSPWGFTDLYCLHHGLNLLRCSGTGLLFQFYWAGY